MIDTVLSLGLKAGLDINDHQLAGYSPLMVAMAYGKMEAAEKILEVEEDLDLGMGPDSLAILHVLSYEWELEKLKYIKEKGGKFNLLDKKGQRNYSGPSISTDKMYLIRYQSLRISHYAQ